MEKHLITQFILEYLKQMVTAKTPPSAEDALNEVLDFIYTMESKLSGKVREMVSSILNT